MPRFQCPACQGTYDDPQPGGSRYFHVCAPLSVPELEALPVDQAHALAPELPAHFTRADLERLVSERRVPRPNARNENIDPAAPPVSVKPGEVPDLESAPRIAADRRLADRISQ